MDKEERPLSGEDSRQGERHMKHASYACGAHIYVPARYKGME